MKKYVLWLVVFFACCNLNAKTESMNSFDQAIEYIKQHANTKTLVLLDVDDVLICPKELFDFRTTLRQDFKNNVRKTKSRQEIQQIFSAMFLKRQVELVDPKVLDLLAYVEEQHIPTAAISAWWTGKFGQIEHMEQIRVQELDQVGISFVGVSPFTKNQEWLEASKNPKAAEGNPMIYAGIVLTNMASKGEVLDWALEQANLDIDTIIFLDDQLNYLEQVEQTANRRGVHFFGIHFTQATHKPIPTIDPDLDRERLMRLERDHIWLDDEEIQARNLMKESF